MFLPTTREEVKKLGWDGLDVILVSGDTYIDSPFIGVAMVGKLLVRAGFRVGIIAQPDTSSDRDIRRLGEPEVFWGISGGCVDSMVANYTASKKKRKTDDFTPGNKNVLRPDRAVIAYANLIRRFFKDTKPLVLGGIEASLRRIAHYDFWSDRIRRSILFDAKADILVYGMADNTVVALADALKRGYAYTGLRGICYIAREKKRACTELPSFEAVTEDAEAFSDMFTTFYQNNDPLTGQCLCQRQDTRYLIQNQPPLPLTKEEIDAVYSLDFERDLHPYYRKEGNARALETIRFSVTTHRGCYGECNFCAIAVHQGRTIQSRSRMSIVHEIERLIAHPDFKGYIHDVGGPTANMYGVECEKKIQYGACNDKRCLFPEICPMLPVNHAKQIELLRELRNLPGIKKIFVASGVRYDLLLADSRSGGRYLDEVVAHHVSGQMKTAPEHTEPHVLSRMGKPDAEALVAFKKMFDRATKKVGKKQFLTYYLIAAHPGCTENDMKEMKQFISRKLRTNPEQVQIFTPTPSTYSSLMYYTGRDPFTGERIFVEKDLRKKERQKAIIVEKGSRKKEKGRREKVRR